MGQRDGNEARLRQRVGESVRERGRDRQVRVSNLVFYARSTITVISGRDM